MSRVCFRCQFRERNDCLYQFFASVDGFFTIWGKSIQKLNTSLFNTSNRLLCKRILTNDKLSSGWMMRLLAAGGGTLTGTEVVEEEEAVACWGWGLVCSDKGASGRVAGCTVLVGADTTGAPGVGSSGAPGICGFWRGATWDKLLKQFCNPITKTVCMKNDWYCP